MLTEQEYRQLSTAFTAMAQPKENGFRYVLLIDIYKLLQEFTHHRVIKW
jgi:hypothetical protein